MINMRENKNICKIKGCDRTLYVKKHRLCLSHYQRFVRTGDAGKDIIRQYRELQPFEAHK